MSQDKKSFVIAGYSGHAFVVIDCLLQAGYGIRGYLEKKEKTVNPYKLPFLGDESDENLGKYSEQSYAALGIGSNSIRQKVFQKLESRKFEFPNIISPNAEVSKYARLDKGNFINRGTIINAFGILGKGVIVNTGAIIEHECKLEDFVHVAPGAVLTGNVKVGRGTFIGANAVVREGVSIGRSVIIGAGSVVLNDISDGETWAGNPARKLD